MVKFFLMNPIIHHGGGEFSRDNTFLCFFAESSLESVGWHTPEALHCTDGKEKVAVADKLGKAIF